MLLVITEKKDQLEPFAKANDPYAKKVSSNFWIANSEILNMELHLVCARGHLLGLAAPERYVEEWGDRSKYTNLPMLPREYRFEIKKDTNYLLNKITEEAKLADGIVLATDPDIEGETIGRLILSKIPGGKEKLRYRLWNSSLTIDASKKAFQKLLDPNQKLGLYNAGLTRQESDWLVGMNISRVASIKLREKGYRGIWSVGRVQTPILSLVVRNDLAIQNFKPKPYWEIKAKSKDNEVNFILNPNQKFENKAEAQTLIEKMSNNIVVHDIKTNHKKIPAPKLFKLSKVQKEAANKWGYSPSEVMEIIEEMYLKGIMGYPRTDSEVISIDEFNILKNNLEKFKAVLSMNFETPNLTPRSHFVVDSAKIGGHPALVPTENIPNMNELPEAHRNIYKLITLRSILQFSADFEYDETNIMGVDVNNDEFKWCTTGKTVINSGWHKLIQKKDQETLLPEIREGEVISVVPNLVQKMTTKPKRYTQGQLIDSVLGKYKLGTEATKAQIIKSLIEDKKYIKINKKGELFPTNNGLVLYEFMKGTMYVNPEMTANWEHNLTLIERHKLSREEFLNHVEDNIKNTVEQYRDIDVELSIPPENGAVTTEELPRIITCPFCKKDHLVLIMGENKNGKWRMYGCSSDKCKGVIPFSFSGYQLELQDLEKISRYGKTDKISEFKSKQGKIYSARLVIQGKKIKPEFSD